MAFSMGNRLRAEVERQLLLDLTHYGIAPDGLWVDWSDTIGEGHCTDHLGGFLEACSGLRVCNAAGEVLYDGWMDFVHGGDAQPLFVFWLFLDERLAGDEYRELKGDPHLPPHVWAALPESSKRLCGKRGEYDAAWQDAPLVLAWLQTQHSAPAPVPSWSRQLFKFLTPWLKRGKK